MRTLFQIYYDTNLEIIDEHYEYGVEYIEEVKVGSHTDNNWMFSFPSTFSPPQPARPKSIARLSIARPTCVTGFILQTPPEKMQQSRLNDAIRLVRKCQTCPGASFVLFDRIIDGSISRLLT